MDHSRDSRQLETDAERGQASGQARRASNDGSKDDPKPRASLLGPLPRARSEEELAAYGYAGQGYPIYGQRRTPPPDDPEPAWFAEPASAAFAFGYTTALRPNDPFPSSASPVSGGHHGHGPKDYWRADARVLEDVCDRLSDDDDLDASDVSVSVEHGEVTLAGTVADRHGKRRAELLAASVRGVLDVHNHLRATKGLWRELGDKLAGDADEHHGHHGSGTRVEATR